MTGQRHGRPYRADGPDRANRPYRADRLRVEAGQRHSPPADIVTRSGKALTFSSSPERIMSMAEKQTDHRISCESRIIELKGRENLLGQIAGFLIAICCLVVACILGLNGHDWLAGVIPTSIAGLAAVFVLRKKKESKEAKGTTDADPEQE